jgi:hypothetical protein
LAIPRCPKCWGYEYECVEYIDRRGRVIKYRPKPHRESEDFIPCWHEDIGCEFATDFQGSQSKCECCPFPKCVEDKGITWAERDYLKQWRMMIKAYDLADEGLSPLEISRETGVSKYMIGEWLKRRDFFELFIRQPIMAGGVKWKTIGADKGKGRRIV